MVEKLKSILEKKFYQHPVLGELLREQKISSCWSEVVGANFQSATRPVHLKRGVLTLAVNGPAWHQEVNFLKDKILAGLNSQLGGNFVRSIKCLVAGEKEFSSIRELTAEISAFPKWYLPGDPGQSLKEALGRLTLMDEQLKKWRREKMLKTCPVCGSFCLTRKKLCPACRTREDGRNYGVLVELVRKNPDKSLGQLKKIRPDMTEASLKKARQLILEEGEKLLKFFKAAAMTGQPVDQLLNYREQLIPYLVLRAGRPLSKMDRRLLKKMLGDKIYYHLKNSLI